VLDFDSDVPLAAALSAMTADAPTHSIPLLPIVERIEQEGLSDPSLKGRRHLRMCIQKLKMLRSDGD
jgi:hypothetical protein